MIYYTPTTRYLHPNDKLFLTLAYIKKIKCCF